MNWTDKALSLLMDHTSVVLVSLCAVHGSAPRDAGAKMLIWDGGQWGTIGGGELEFRLTAQAHEMLQVAAAKPVLADFPLGPVLGQCCGGFVRALLEPLTLESVDWLRIFAGGEHALLTDIRTGAKTCSPSNNRSGRVQIMDADKQAHPDLMPLNQCQFIYEEPAAALVPLYLFGAGHIGAALHRVLFELSFRVVWADPRAGMPAQHIVDPVSLVEGAPDNARFVIVTHSHDLDYALCAAILARETVVFCGLIGSKTKRARFVARLRKSGLTAHQINRLTCPIGLAGIGGKLPGEIAVAIAAQLLEQRKEEPNGN